MSQIPTWAKTAGAVAIAAMIAYASYKIYKNYLSKAARACKGKPDKSSCMNQFKMKGLQNTIANLQKSSSLCNKSKDPAKCKAKMTKSISKTKAKLAKLQSKIKENTMVAANINSFESFPKKDKVIKY